MSIALPRGHHLSSGLSSVPIASRSADTFRAESFSFVEDPLRIAIRSTCSDFAPTCVLLTRETLHASAGIFVIGGGSGGSIDARINQATQMQFSESDLSVLREWIREAACLSR